MIGGFIGKPIGAPLRQAEGIEGVLSKTLDDATLSAAGAVALKATLTKTLDDAALSATGVVAIKGTASITLDDAAIAATGVLALTGALSKTLDDVAISATGAVLIQAVVSVTLDDLTYTIHGGPELSIVDTEVLQLPVDYVLAGHQPYKERGREFEIRPRNIRTSGTTPRSRVGRLRGSPPSFTTTTSKRGYD